MTRAAVEFELVYDLRNPAPWTRPWPSLYGAFLDQVEWADRHGFDAVRVSEHHFSDDGYLPSPLLAASAAAARTQALRLRLGAILLPLRHPVQLAEDIAVLDNLSAGRTEVILAGGYREAEFSGYGIPIRQRPSRIEEAVEIIKRCWTGEEFSFSGRYWSLRDVRVRPQPFQRPRPRIVLGGSSPEAALRAARIADGFAPPTAAPLEMWRDEVRRLGGDPTEAEQLVPGRVIGARTFLHVSEDPEAAWKEVAPHALYLTNSYASWAVGPRPCTAVWTTPRCCGRPAPWPCSPPTSWCS